MSSSFFLLIYRYYFRDMIFQKHLTPHETFKIEFSKTMLNENGTKVYEIYDMIYKTIT